MSYTVEIKPSAHKINVEPDETVLEAALRQGIAFPYSCRGGTCGSCKGRVISGEITYVEEPIALSVREKENGMALFCRARAKSDLVIEVRQVSSVKSIAIKTMPCRVAKREKLADDVIRLFLKLPQSEKLEYMPGQYLDVLLRDGRRRSFSMANLPREDALIELHIRHVPGGFFTTHVFDEMQEKALLRIEVPFGTFFLREDSTRPLILVAGGTGFAPIKAILESVFAKGDTREIYFYWGARHRGLLYLDELPQQWQREHKNFHYISVLSDPLPVDAWSGRTGLVHQAVLDDFYELTEFDVYACGSPAMVEAARQGFYSRGLPDEQFFTDAFTFNNDQDLKFE